MVENGIPLRKMMDFDEDAGTILRVRHLNGSNAATDRFCHSGTVDISVP
jgi:hypothetical protein